MNNKSTAHSKTRPFNPSPCLIKVDLDPLIQGLLQRTANLHSLQSSRQLQRDLGIVQAHSGELIGLGDQGLLEFAIIVLWDLSPDPIRLIHIHQTPLRISIHRQLPLRLDNFCHIMLSRSHHARKIEVSNLPAPELYDPPRHYPRL